MARKSLQPKDIETLLGEYAISERNDESPNSESDEDEDIPIAKRRKLISDYSTSTDSLAFEFSSDENLPPGEVYYFIYISLGQIFS